MRLFRTDYPLTSAFDHVSTSWTLLKEHVWSVFYLAFLPTLILHVGLVIVLADRKFVSDPLAGMISGLTQAGLVTTGAGLLLSTLVYPGWVLFQLRAVRGQKPSALECFQDALPRFISMLSLIAIQLGIVALGLLALVVPGLFAIRGMFLSQYYLIDKNLGPSEAVSMSFKASRPIAGYIWGTIGVMLLFSFMGSTFSYLPVVGSILNIGIPLIFAFGPALRYDEAAKVIDQSKSNKVHTPVDHVRAR